MEHKIFNYMRITTAWREVFRDFSKKNNFFRIWSLDFSLYTRFDLIIVKERTPNSQISARISKGLEFMSDSVQTPQ